MAIPSSTRNGRVELFNSTASHSICSALICQDRADGRDQQMGERVHAAISKSVRAPAIYTTMKLSGRYFTPSGFCLVNGRCVVSHFCDLLMCLMSLWPICLSSVSPVKKTFCWKCVWYCNQAHSGLFANLNTVTLHTGVISASTGFPSSTEL